MPKLVVTHPDNYLVRYSVRKAEDGADLCRDFFRGDIKGLIYSLYKEELPNNFFGHLEVLFPTEDLESSGIPKNERQAITAHVNLLNELHIPKKNKLSISNPPDGYSLTLPIEDDATMKYIQILREGTAEDLHNSLARLPHGFLKAGVEIEYNYGNKSAPHKVPEAEKRTIDALLQTLAIDFEIFE